jgi:Cryptococcal mannosyltransferase 1
LRALAYLMFLLAFGAILLAYTFAPSYTTLPAHYEILKQRAAASTEPGRGNPNGQKVFIASSLFDPGGQLLSGAWADNVLHLIDLLGPENTYLSIYENDSGPEAQLALAGFSAQVPCNKSLVFEEHLSPEGLPTVVVPDGSTRVKRIAYLAEVRNKALKPLDAGTVRFDRVLYLNDVFFDPVDALELLFSTNVDENGQATYRAACAVDFINPFKFYDTFATRDLGGWGMGVPFFPWFSYGGDSRSHSDVLQGKDAVRVRSCWGGMVAFDARFFQRQSISELVPQTVGSESPSNLTAPYRFRAEKDLFWDASECCLIHADIQDVNSEDTGIYMNPFVRCAYDKQTHSWLWFTRRFERLYTPIHFLADIVASLPRLNLRRAGRPWQQVEEEVWIPDYESATGGSFQTVSRVANHASFCGRRKLSVMKQHFTASEKKYEFIPMPGS